MVFFNLLNEILFFLVCLFGQFIFGIDYIMQLNELL